MNDPKISGIAALNLKDPSLFRQQCYLDLVPVVQQAARRLSLELRGVDNDDDDDMGVYRSDWLLLSASPAAFAGPLLKDAQRIDAVPHVGLWTDDYSDLYGILK